MTIKGRLENLFNLKDKSKIAVEIDIILDDHASTITVRLEAEFHFRNESGDFIASTCYVTPPRVGEFIRIGKLKEYEIVKVIHNFNSSSEAGIIIIK